jgi:hypothetical protein
MKPINKDELFEHLGEFLQKKGIEFKDGSYTENIRKGVGLLANTINLGQKGVQAAKEQLDAGLDKVRQVIHEKTAPKGGPAPAAPPPPPPPAAKKAGPSRPKSPAGGKARKRAKR